MGRRPEFWVNPGWLSGKTLALVGEASTGEDCAESIIGGVVGAGG
jgi:hypothetical protein